MQMGSSSCMARAVRAMIGTWELVVASRSRIFRVAISPSITGIWTSIKMASNAA
jgi:hypothetical protein